MKTKELSGKAKRWKDKVRKAKVEMLFVSPPEFLTPFISEMIDGGLARMMARSIAMMKTDNNDTSSPDLGASSHNQKGR